MSIATDAKVRDLEKRVAELEKLETRIRQIESTYAHSERYVKLGLKTVARPKEEMDI